MSFTCGNTHAPIYVHPSIHVLFKARSTVSLRRGARLIRKALELELVSHYPRGFQLLAMKKERGIGKKNTPKRCAFTVVGPSVPP